MQSISFVNCQFSWHISHVQESLEHSDLTYAFFAKSHLKQGRKKSRISIQFLFMDIEAATQCPWDYLMVSAEDLNEVK